MIFSIYWFSRKCFVFFVFFVSLYSIQAKLILVKIYLDRSHESQQIQHKVTQITELNACRTLFKKISFVKQLFIIAKLVLSLVTKIDTNIRFSNRTFQDLQLSEETG